jgi:hypothetical protein
VPCRVIEDDERPDFSMVELPEQENNLDNWVLRESQVCCGNILAYSSTQVTLRFWYSKEYEIYKTHHNLLET